MTAEPTVNRFHLRVEKKNTGVLSFKNKAGYTVTLVACGWAGALIDKVTGAFGQEQLAQNAKKRLKKEKRAPTNQPTDRPTNGWTKQGIESRSTQLKMLS